MQPRIDGVLEIPPQVGTHGFPARQLRRVSPLVLVLFAACAPAKPVQDAPAPPATARAVTTPPATPAPRVAATPVGAATPTGAPKPAAPPRIWYQTHSGDLNGDGRAEAITWDSESKKIAIWDYSSGARKQITSQVLEGNLSSLVVADIDGDGKGEIILAQGIAGSKEGPQGEVRLSVFEPLEKGHWIPVEIFRQETERADVPSLAVVNLDKDPAPEILFSYMSSKFQADLAVADRVGDSWKVEQRGRVRMGMHVTAGDVLRDEQVRVVVGRPYGDYGEPQEDTVPLGDAFVLDGEKRIALPAFRGVSSVAAGDVDGDGHDDIIIGDGWHRDYGKVARSRLALIRRLQGKWKYDLIEDVPGSIRIEKISLVDVNRDGKDEVIVWASRNVMLEGYVRLYQNTASGWRGVTLADSVQDFAVGDFTGDGKLEVIFAGAEPRMLALKPSDFKWDAQLAQAVETIKVDPKALIGKSAPEISADTWIGGTPVSLAGLKGKVVLLDFWATWCAPCIAAFPTMREWLSKYGPQGFVVIGMTNHSNQTSEDVRKFLTKRPLPWVVPIDPSNRTHLAYGTGNLPHQVLVDRQGVVHAYYTGSGGTLKTIEQDIRKLLIEPTATAAPPSKTPSDWKTRVEAAGAISDEALRRDAMAALVREALGQREVHVAGNTSPDRVGPVDYKPAPVVNFDVRLSKKSSERNVSLVNRSSYYFAASGKPYVVLGPAALDSKGPVFTRMDAAHDLYHAAYHVGDPRPIAERELEVWTHVFVNYFHEIYPFKQKWSPLVDFYEQASPAERRLTLDQLVAYYRDPPASPIAGADDAVVRTAFAEWLNRRVKDPDTASKKLVQELKERLKL